MRIAIISDVHGNIEALNTVIRHSRLQSVDAIVNLGDCVTAPLWPQETFDELQSLGATTIRGNHDRWLKDADRLKSSEVIAFTAAQLSAESVATLVALPSAAFLFDSVLAVHGTPASDTEYLFEDNIDGRLCPVTSATLAERIGDTSAELVLCGHSHQQHAALGARGKLAINPGSVGCPRYAGNEDAMSNEAGSPHARYAVATRHNGQWSAELFVLAYDWRPVVERARDVGHRAWANAFLKGSE